MRSMWENFQVGHRNESSHRKRSWEVDSEAVETPATIYTTVTVGLCHDVNQRKNSKTKPIPIHEMETEDVHS